MIPRIVFCGLIATSLITLCTGLAVPEVIQPLSTNIETNSIAGNGESLFSNGNKAASQQQSTIFGQSSLNPSRKFGEEPTDRVLPVDQPLDYEDLDEEDVEQNEILDADEKIHGKDYCARVLRADLIKVLKKMRRSPRQESAGSAGAAEAEPNLIESYLDFDPSKIVSPLLSIMGSAMKRNVTAIDEHYKQLPSLVKTEVTDFIDIFTELLKTFQ